MQDLVLDVKSRSFNSTSAWRVKIVSPLGFICSIDPGILIQPNWNFWSFSWTCRKVWLKKTKLFTHLFQEIEEMYRYSSISYLSWIFQMDHLRDIFTLLLCATMKHLLSSVTCALFSSTFSPLLFSWIQFVIATNPVLLILLSNNY